MLRRFGRPFAISAAALALSVAASAPARAATLINWNGTQVWANPWVIGSTTISWNATDIGVWKEIYFNGVTQSGANNVVAPGVAAAVTLRLLSVTPNDKTWNFSYSIWNDTLSPDSSRVSIFGFDVTPNRTTATSTGVFNNVGTGNVPILQISDDVCLSDKPGNANCSGGGSGGVTAGHTAGGNFTVNFATGTPTFTLGNPFVRYQDLSVPSLHITGGSGVGEPVGWVPEPETWALMILGFFGAGAVLRRHRRQPTMAV